MVNRRGFTLVEVLAVVIILSVLSIMVIPNVSEYVAQGKDEYNKSLKKTLTLAGKNFYSDNKVRIPKPVGVVTDFVTANELSSQNYLTGSFVDSDKNDCKSKSYVVAVNDYFGVDYHACLVCGDKSYFDTSDESKYCVYNSNSSGGGSSGDTGDISDDTSTVNPVCDVVSQKNDGDNYVVSIKASTSKGKISDINLVNVTNKTSKSIDFEGENNIYKDIVIDSFGTFDIYVVNSYNRRTKCPVEIENEYPVSPKFDVKKYLVSEDVYNKYKDGSIPSSELDSLSSYNGDSWSKGYVYVVLNYNSKHFDKVEFEGSSIKKKKYLWLYEEGDKKYTINTVDKEGNSNNVNLNTMLDRTPPVIGKIDNSSNGVWVNQTITVKTPYSDSYSGIDRIEYSTDNKNWITSWDSNTGSLATKIWKNSSNINYSMYIRAYDKVGNMSNLCNGNVQPCNTNVHIDITPPVMYKHCLYKVASKKWYFRYYFSDSGGSGYSGYKWGYCYRICPKCPSSYMCSYRSADSKAAASGTWYSSSYKETSYQIVPTSSARTIGSTTRLYFRDNAGNVATGSYTDTWYYGGGSSPGSC